VYAAIRDVALCLRLAGHLALKRPAPPLPKPAPQLYCIGLQPAVRRLFLTFPIRNPQSPQSAIPCFFRPLRPREDLTRAPGYSSEGVFLPLSQLLALAQEAQRERERAASPPLALPEASIANPSNWPAR